MKRNNKKRAWNRNLNEQRGVGQTLAQLRNPDPMSHGDSQEETRETKRVRMTQSPNEEKEYHDEKERKHSSVRGGRSDTSGKSSYPSTTYSANNRLQTSVKISDLQSLILYVLGDGPAPQWVAIRNRTAIRQVVVLMVPGLEHDMFTGALPLDSPLDSKRSPDEEGNDDSPDSKALEVPRSYTSPDDYYPSKLKAESLHEALKPLAEIFPHVWPIKTPGDDHYNKIHSPLQAILNVSLEKSKDQGRQKPSRENKKWQDEPTPITDYIATEDELISNDYVLHPASFTSDEKRVEAQKVRESASQTTEHGWLDTPFNKDETPSTETDPGRAAWYKDVITLDCEMCKTGEDRVELTRISVMAWDSTVLLDELVKPENEITDYLTMYSGITKEMLEPVTKRLVDIQQHLLTIITPQTIIMGHSLNSDLTALKMTHPRIIDTSILYPHPRGPPLKSSLKYLANKYLKREIQNRGPTGHNSIEDAKACLDLVKQKCNKGPKWGTNEAMVEPIFKTLARSKRPNGLQTGAESSEELSRTGAVVDWGDPRRGLGATAAIAIACSNDLDVVKGVKSLVTRTADVNSTTQDAQPVDFVWARLRELEAVRGWWGKTKTHDNELLRINAISQADANGTTDAKEEIDSGDGTTAAAAAARATTNGPTLADVVAKTVGHIVDIYDTLAPCTTLIVYSGTGDPRDMVKLQALYQQYQKEYKTRKWDELTVQWTDTEQSSLRNACRKARKGIGFVVTK